MCYLDGSQDRLFKTLSNLQDHPSRQLSAGSCAEGNSSTQGWHKLCPRMQTKVGPAWNWTLVAIDKSWMQFHSVIRHTINFCASSWKLNSIRKRLSSTWCLYHVNMYACCIWHHCYTVCFHRTVSWGYTPAFQPGIRSTCCCLGIHTFYSVNAVVV